MNRTSINLLSIIFITVLAASILVPGFAMMQSFSEGFKDGMNARVNATRGDVIEMPGIPVEVVVKTVEPYSDVLQDTLTTDDGHRFPIQINKATATVPTSNYTIGVMLIVALCFTAFVAMFVLFAIQLIKFVVNINRGIIFDRLNVKRLKKIGIFLLIMALLQVAIGLAEDYAVSGMNVTFEGMSLTSYWTIPWSELLLGVMSLLIAQVWSRGVQMKEEQELTI